MWQIVKNEWSFLYRNSTLLGISLGFLLALALTVFLGMRQTEQEQALGEVAQNHLREQWESLDELNPHGAAHYGTYVFKPSNLLSGLDEGVSSVTGNVLRIEGHVQNEMVHSEAAQMQSVSRFGKLKSSLLLQYVLPLLLLFLSFNSVNREKQSGRLKLLVLQGAKPGRIVWAKTLSIWIFSLVLLTLTVVVYALLHAQSMSAEVLTRSLFFFLAYAAYYFVVCGLTVFFSVRWKSPTLGLTAMLGIWIMWSIFLPGILLSTVEKWHQLPSRDAFKLAMKEDRAKGIDGHNPTDARAEKLKQQVLDQYEVDSLSQLPINFDGIRMQADEEYGNQVWDKHFGRLRAVLASQKQTYQLGGIFNPFISLQNASMGFTASDNLHHHEFLVQAENYRRAFIKLLNDEHAYGGSTTGEWGWKADNAFFKSVPDFEYQPVPIRAVLSRYVTDLLLLAVWVGLVVLFLIVGTQSMEIV